MRWRPDPTTRATESSAHRPHDLTNSYPTPLHGPQFLYYYLGIADPWMPAWKTIGQFMRWNARVDAVTDDFVRFTFDLPDDRPLPPYIGIHIRRGDFGTERTLGVYIDQVTNVRRMLNDDPHGPYHGRADELAVMVRSWSRPF